MRLEGFVMRSGVLVAGAALDSGLAEFICGLARWSVAWGLVC
jgi:hypothetical protein